LVFGSLIAVFALLVTVHLASCQITLVGNCTTVQVVPDFDANKFVGTWYEIKKYYYYFSLGATCVKETFTAKPDGTFAVERAQTRFFAQEKVNGTAKVLSPGVMSLYFPTYLCKLNKFISFQNF
jgi:apolipoprotein D and lipocalin family protein